MIDKLLLKILKSETAELPNIIIECINGFAFEKYDIIKDSEYTFFKLRGGKSDNNIMLSAHIDTVHLYLPKIIKKQESAKGLLLSAKEGIGADDRGGVYAVIKTVERLIKYYEVYPKYILFTNDEEIGFVGARKFSEDYKGEIDIDTVFEFDANEDTALFLPDMNDENFKTFIYKYFGTDGVGYPSDATIFQSCFTKKVVNIGVGFDKWHRNDETLNVDQLNSQILKASKTIATLIKK